MSDGTLAALGWTDEHEAAFQIHAERGFEPARVVAEHRGGSLVRGERDERLAQARGRLRDNELWGSMPAVGDWVAVCDAPGGRYAIEGFLPRRSKVSRKTPWLKARTFWSRTSTRFFSCRGSTGTSILDVSSATSWPPGTRGPTRSSC